MPRKGFPLGTFFEPTIPLTDAVAAAHDKGIVHRDLKPGNVMVGEDGRVTVLDFGIAKPEDRLEADIESESPTELRAREGVIAGSVHYMLPEQAEGKKVDHRSDIFSIGILLYEMVTGQRPFEGASATSILSSILKDTPQPVTAMTPAAPYLVEQLIRRCMTKDLEHRCQTARDVRNELELVAQKRDSGVSKSEAFAQPEASKSRRSWALASAGAA